MNEPCGRWCDALRNPRLASPALPGLAKADIRAGTAICAHELTVDSVAVDMPPMGTGSERRISTG